VERAAAALLDRKQSNPHQHRRVTMQCYFEQIGILGPIYRLLSRGWSNQDIATHLGRTDEIIDGCVEWLLRFLKIRTREELVFVAETERLTKGRRIEGIEMSNWWTTS
jgi:DNA-binding NarL/FixJ family response regulator